MIWNFKENYLEFKEYKLNSCLTPVNQSISINAIFYLVLIITRLKSCSYILKIL